MDIGKAITDTVAEIEQHIENGDDSSPFAEQAHHAALRELGRVNQILTNALNTLRQYKPLKPGRGRRKTGPSEVKDAAKK